MLLPQRERKHFYVSGKNCCLLRTRVFFLCLCLMSVSSTCLYWDWKGWPSTCFSSNRVHWLYLFCHSGNQWSSYFCFTHHCGWVRVIVSKSLRIHSVSLRKLPPFDCLFLVSCSRVYVAVTKREVTSHVSTGRVFSRWFPADGRVFSPPQRCLSQVLRLVARLRFLWRCADRQWEEEVAGSGEIWPIRYEGRALLNLTDSSG